MEQVIDLTVSIDHLGGVVILALRGPLVVATAPIADVTLNGVIDAGHHDIVVDASSIDSVDSTGVACLLTASDRARDAGGSFVVRNPTQDVGALLQRLRPEALLDSQPSDRAGR